MSNTLIGPPISYVDLLDDKLAQKGIQAEEDLKLQNKAALKHPLRPSSAGECERALAFKLMEFMGFAYYEKAPVEPRVARIFGLGHAIEAMLLDMFEEVEFMSVRYKQQVLTFFDLKSEKNPALNTLVEGSNDGCFIGRNGDFKCVFDVKSKGTGIGKFKRTKWEEQDAIFDEMQTVERFSETGVWVNDLQEFLDELDDDMFAMNFWQLNLYLHSAFMKERGFNHGSILQFSKDDSKMREIRFRPHEGLYLKTKARFENVIKALESKDPYKAGCEFELGSQKCAYCPFNKMCWGEEQDALKTYFREHFPNKKWPETVKGALAEKIVAYTELEKQDKEKSRLKKEIIRECLDKGLDKVQINKDLVYEIKKLKTTIDLRRSKI